MTSSFLAGDTRQTLDHFRRSVDNNARAQLAYGKFYAAVTLPGGLNVDKLTCRLPDGILDIQIPVSEQMRRRQIQIQAGESRKSVSA
ncbi:MAG: Hsp20 family protein [Bryobacteraceae bacterium]|jgi:HSP20 family molecular chaperone IbpA